MTQKVYWQGDLPEKDPWGNPYGNTMYDSRIAGTHSWANMSERSWKVFGIPKLGTGYGQKYEKQPDGKWLKVEG